jgi:hypothetical protein
MPKGTAPSLPSPTLGCAPIGQSQPAQVTHFPNTTQKLRLNVRFPNVFFLFTNHEISRLLPIFIGSPANARFGHYWDFLGYVGKLRAKLGPVKRHFDQIQGAWKTP